MRLQAKVWILAWLISTVVINPCLAHSETTNQITRAVRSASAENISFFFDRMVDITINDKFNTYSKAQAEMVLDKFFEKQKIKSYEVIHSGYSNDSETIYIIGEMITQSKQGYRLYFLLKRRGGDQYVIQSLRIDD